MSQTRTEKFFSRASGKSCKADDIVIVTADLVMCHDATMPMALDFLNKLDNLSIAHPERMVLAEDHYVPCPSPEVAKLQERMRNFANLFGIKYYKGGNGVGHRLVVEQGHVSPGMFAVGGDSHTTTYGALNTFSTGIGSSDIAGVLYSGKIWMRVPQAIKIILRGRPPKSVGAMDIALALASKLGSSGARYKVLEYYGEGIKHLSMEARLSICNMAVESGAKAGIMPYDKTLRNWLKNNPRLNDNFPPVEADENVDYSEMVELDLSSLEPCVAIPHGIEEIKNTSELNSVKINMAVMGTCTNGSFDDMQIAASILKDNEIHSDVQLIIAPPSKQILEKCIEEGLMNIFIRRGAMVLPPSCGPCCGALNGVPIDGQNIISTANRNFKGRMGNVKSFVYLASPATVIHSAVKGFINHKECA